MEILQTEEKTEKEAGELILINEEEVKSQLNQPKAGSTHATQPHQKNVRNFLDSTGHP